MSDWTPEQNRIYQELVLQQAFRYLKQGFSIISLRFRDKKPDIAEWETYQTRLPTEQEIKTWFSDNESHNLAIILGKVSGNLVAMDCDDEDFAREQVEYFLGESLAQLAAKTIIVQTKRGYHIYFRIDIELKHEDFHLLEPIPVAFEIRANEHYIVGPPSIHPSGISYSFLGQAQQLLDWRAGSFKEWRNKLTDLLEEWPFVRLIIPHWKSPDEGGRGRQNLCLGVAGFIRKQLEWPEERAKKIIEKICFITDDKEINQRISAIQSTYRRDDLDTVSVESWLGVELSSLLKSLQAKTKKQKKKKVKAKEEKKRTALRIIGNIVYRQVKNDAGMVFARFDRTTGDISYVDHIPETDEWPVINEGINFPRRLAPYGTPALLYKRLRDRINYGSSQIGHKNAIFAMFLLYHGCIPPFARKNPQIFPMGPASTGKGRYVDLARHLGDRARVTTDVKMATSYRLNALLNGGLEILDEMPDEDLEVEAYIRSRYDPEAVQQRLLDPHSESDIKGFRIAGPTMVTRRRAFKDDANTDRGIILNCERPIEPVPLELIDHAPDQELHDQLALFWSEYYGDERLLPKEGELMYDPKLENADPRLILASRYYMKLAKIIGPEAQTDLENFVQEQELLRLEHKATTIEGMTLRALWEIIQENLDGRHYSYQDKKSGEKRRVCDTLTCEHRAGKCVIYITQTPEDGGEDMESKARGISWTMIAEKAATGFGRELPNVLLAPHTVTRMIAGLEHHRIKTIGFKITNLDLGFRTFLPEYDPTWKDRLSDNGGQQVSLDNLPPKPLSMGRDEELPPVAAEKSAPSLPLPGFMPLASRTTTSESPSKPVHMAVSKVESPVESLVASIPVSQTAVTKTGISGKSYSVESNVLETINQRIQVLQATLCPNSLEHEVQIFQWAITYLVDAKQQGNRPTAFHLRSDGRRLFSKWETDLIKIIDSGFVELEHIAQQICEVRRSQGEKGGNAS